MKVLVWDSGSQSLEQFLELAQEYAVIDVYEDLNGLLADATDEDLLVLDLDTERKRVERLVKSLSKAKVRPLIVYLCNSLSPKELQKHQNSKVGADAYLRFPMERKTFAGLMSPFFPEGPEEAQEEDETEAELPENTLDDAPFPQEMQVPQEMKIEKDLAEEEIEEEIEEESLEAEESELTPPPLRLSAEEQSVLEAHQEEAASSEEIEAISEKLDNAFKEVLGQTSEAAEELARVEEEERVEQASGPDELSLGAFDLAEFEESKADDEEDLTADGEEGDLLELPELSEPSESVEEEDKEAEKEPMMANDDKDLDLQADELEVGEDLDLGVGEEVDLGAGDDLDLGAGDDLDLGAGEELDLGAGEELDLGAGEELDLGAGEDLDLGAGEDLDLGAGEDLDLGAGEELDLGAVEDLDLGAGEDLDLGASEELDLGAVEDLDLGAVEDLDLGAGDDLDLGAGDDLDLGAGEDLELGAGDDLDLGAGEELDMSGGDDLDLDAGADLNFGEEEPDTAEGNQGGISMIMDLGELEMDGAEEEEASSEIEAVADEAPAPMQEMAIPNPDHSGMSADALKKLAEIEEMMKNDATGAVSQEADPGTGEIDLAGMGMETPQITNPSLEAQVGMEDDEPDYNPTLDDGRPEATNILSNPLAGEDKFEDFLSSSPAAERTIADQKDVLARNDEEFLRLGETIRQLREDRQELLNKIQDLEERIAKEKRDFTLLEAELEEKKIEISLINKRKVKRLEEVVYGLELSEEKRLALEEKNRRLERENEELRRKSNLDVSKVRARERELESKLELLKADTETQLKNRDMLILELKRKIDTLEFDIESIQLKEKKTVDSNFAMEERMERVINTLRRAIGELEDEDIPVRGLDKVKKSLDV